MPSAHPEKRDRDQQVAHHRGQAPRIGQPDQRRSAEEGSQQSRFAVIPFGRTGSRFLTLPSERGYSYLLLEDAVEFFIADFFPDIVVEHCGVFRITRNADLALREDMAADLLAGMEEVISARKESDCVRLEISAAGGETIESFLKSSLDVTDQEVFAAPGPLDLASFFRLSDLSGFESLKYESWPPQPSS